MSRPATIIPMTKAQILERIAKGPTTFEELAIAKNSQHKARTTARRLCNELSDEGAVLQIFIGPYRYFILNTEEGKRQAIVQQIEENSRKDAETGCTVWTGYTEEVRGPAMRQSLIHPSKPVSVRRWLFADLTGKPLSRGDVVRMKSRCAADCIDPAHMVKKTRSQILKGKEKSITHRIALQQAAKARWGKRPDAVSIIRSSDKSRHELAEELDMTPSNVWLIKTGRTHNLGVQENPFAGLLRP